MSRLVSRRHSSQAASPRNSSEALGKAAVAAHASDRSQAERWSAAAVMKDASSISTPHLASWSSSVGVVIARTVDNVSEILRRPPRVPPVGLWVANQSRILASTQGWICEFGSRWPQSQSCQERLVARRWQHSDFRQLVREVVSI